MSQKTVDPVRWFNQKFEPLAEKLTLDSKEMKEYCGLLKNFSELVGNGRVLDAGCGWGRDVNYFLEQGFDAVGVDRAPKPLKYGAKKYSIAGERLHRMDVANLAFEDRSFDGVWCNSVIFFYHKDEMEKIIKELSRVLKKGGILYINFKLSGDLEKESYVREEYDGSKIRRHLVTEQEAERKLQKHGLKILSEPSSISNDGENEPPYLSFFCRKSS